jgi:hypothetical protein
LESLAETYRIQKRWTEEELLRERTIDAQVALQGEEHHDTIIAMRDLALIHWNRAHWGKAEFFFSRVSRVMSRASGEDHIDTLTAKAHLAATYCNQGRWDEAAKLELQVVHSHGKSTSGCNLLQSRAMGRGGEA